MPKARPRTLLHGSRPEGRSLRSFWLQLKRLWSPPRVRMVRRSSR